jgi:hypothetical protein
MQPQQPVIYKYSLQHALASKLLIVVAVGSLLLGAVFGVLGVLLVYSGATADTQITLFGQRLSSGSVGVASLFIAAVTVVMLSRRVLKSFDELIARTIK